MKVGLFVSIAFKIWSSVHPLKYDGRAGAFFYKTFFIGDKKFWLNSWLVVLHGGTNDQMIPRGEGKFHKCIFQ